LISLPLCYNLAVGRHKTKKEIIMQRYGRYVVRKELGGGGGMGIVYLAHDPLMNREVALKVISWRMMRQTPTEGGENVLKRFRHEAQVLASLQHRAIVPVYDFGQEGNEPYLVMQLMEGGSLAEKLGAGALQMSQMVRILGELAPALDDMHRQKIIHRDLKPANILFDRWGNPYISDFGLAKLTEKAASFSAGGVKGTPAYMSPEQVRGHTLDGRSDIYSLGGILFEMLTSQQPYHQAMPGFGQLFSHINEPPPRLSPLRSDLSPAWQTLIDRVMAKTPAERPATASQFVNELKILAEAAPQPRQRSSQRVRTTVLRQESPSPRVTKPPRKPPLGIGSERVCPKDGMIQVYVPAGKFLMGSRDDDSDAESDEKPQHTVHLDAYWIDKTPVTNAMFTKFVAETGYVTEAEKKGWAYEWTASTWEKINGAQWRHPRGSQSNLGGKDNHPVVSVSWNDAVAYAKWAERRLPTEAEWEKAAGGTDGRKWPWGNEPPTDKLCNFNRNVGDTTPVGNYPDGASLYGALDMAGNVWEWCHDNFEENYYASSPKANPPGPKPIGTKALRGGSWYNTARSPRVRYRYWVFAGYRGAYRGFRCARSPI
jgi:serine/threonine-protein kinase